MVICTFIDLAEFIPQMAKNIHTFGGSPIFCCGHPGKRQYKIAVETWVLKLSEQAIFKLVLEASWFLAEMFIFVIVKHELPVFSCIKYELLFSISLKTSCSFSTSMKTTRSSSPMLKTTSSYLCTGFSFNCPTGCGSVF